MLVCYRPDLSILEPVAVGSAAALHVLESGGIEMTRGFGVACGTFVSAAAMGPAVLSRCGGARTGIIAAAIVLVSATTAATVDVAWSGPSSRRIGALRRAHEGHHLLHLEEEGTFASLKIGFAALK